jgi:hypothetical protein
MASLRLVPAGGSRRIPASQKAQRALLCQRVPGHNLAAAAHFQVDDTGGGDVSSTGGTSRPSSEPTGSALPGVPVGGRALLVTLAMAQFMVVLDFTIVNVALPSIQHGLHVATTTL